MRGRTFETMKTTLREQSKLYGKWMHSLTESVLVIIIHRYKTIMIMKVMDMIMIMVMLLMMMMIVMMMMMMMMMMTIMMMMMMIMMMMTMIIYKSAKSLTVTTALVGILLKACVKVASDIVLFGGLPQLISLLHSQQQAQASQM